MIGLKSQIMQKTCRVFYFFWNFRLFNQTNNYFLFDNIIKLSTCDPRECICIYVNSQSSCSK